MSPMPRLLLITLLLPGCKDKSTADTGEELPPPCTNCVLDDGQNYRYSAELEVVSKPASSFDETLIINWSGVTEDVHGHTSPGQFQVTQATLLALLDFSQEQTLEALAQDTLPQAEVSLFATCAPEEPRCAIADFELLGNSVNAQDYFEPGRGTWMVLLQSDFEAGGHAFVFLEPTDGGPTTVSIDNDSSDLHADVDLSSMTPLVVEAGSMPSVDWSNLTKDGLGNDLSLHTISRVMLARYAATPTELESQVFDLEREADGLWEADVSQRTEVSFAELVGDDALSLSTGDDTWLLALWCDACTNPAPKFVTRVVPVAE